MNRKKPIAIGCVIALVINIITSTIYAYYVSPAPLLDTIGISYRNGALGSIIVLGGLPNLGLFFLFLKLNYELEARGVLLASIITAFTTLVIKFL